MDGGRDGPQSGGAGSVAAGAGATVGTVPVVPLSPPSVPATLAVLAAAVSVALSAPGSGGRAPVGAQRGSARGAVATSPALAAAALPVRYRPPVATPIRVVRPFQAPSGPYGPGHRGADLAASPGAPVVAAGDGVVAFAGPVAGRGVVVLRHADGVRTEYEPVAPTVRAGEQVAAGQRIGVLAGHHPGCAGSCLHWGALRGATYFDPLRLLVPLGVVRLVPVP